MFRSLISDIKGFLVSEGNYLLSTSNHTKIKLGGREEYKRRSKGNEKENIYQLRPLLLELIRKRNFIFLICIQQNGLA